MELKDDPCPIVHCPLSIAHCPLPIPGMLLPLDLFESLLCAQHTLAAQPRIYLCNVTNRK